MLDVIKEYLVRLGYDVDVQGFNQAQNSINALEKAMGRMAFTTAGQFAIAGAVVTSFVTISTLAIAKFIGSVAEADYQTEVFAKRFFTSEESARAFQASLKALGMEMGDLFYTTNEQYDRFLRLRQEALALEAPAEVQQQLKDIREVQFQFARLNVTLSQGRYWLAHYFLEFMTGDVQTARKDLTEFVDKIQKNLPQIAEKVGAGMAVIARLGMVIYYTVRDVGDAIFSLLDAIPFQVKAMVAAVGVALFATSGPIGFFIVAITGLLLLLEDFYTYLEGGESLFAGLWEWLMKMGEAIEQSEGFQNLKDAAKNLWTEIDRVITSAKNLMKELDIDLPKIETLLKPVSLALKGIAATLDHIASLAKQLQDLGVIGKSLLKGDKKGAMEAFQDWAERDWVLKGLGIDKWIRGIREKAEENVQSTPVPGVPSATGHSSQSGGVNQTNHFNIYGSSDPGLTAKAVVDQNGLLLRNLQGVIG